MVTLEEIYLDLLLLGYFDLYASREHNKTLQPFDKFGNTRAESVTVSASFWRKIALAGEYLDSWGKLFPLKALTIEQKSDAKHSL